MIELSEFLKACNSIYDEIDIIELKSFTSTIELAKQGKEDFFTEQMRQTSEINNPNVLRVRTYKFYQGLTFDTNDENVNETIYEEYEDYGNYGDYGDYGDYGEYKLDTEYNKSYEGEELLREWERILEGLKKENLNVVFFKTVLDMWFDEDNGDILEIYCVKN